MGVNWNVLVEELQEGQEVLAVAGLGGHRRDTAAVDLQGGEQVLGAVAHVLVVAPAGPARLCLGVFADQPLGLDAGLLVDRDDDRVLGRVEVKATDLGRLGVEGGRELRHHPVLGEVGLDVGRGSVPNAMSRFLGGDRLIAALAVHAVLYRYSHSTESLQVNPTTLAVWARSERPSR